MEDTKSKEAILELIKTEMRGNIKILIDPKKKDSFSEPGDDQYHYYLRDDKKGISCFQYWPTLYKLDEEGEYETLFGDRCSPYSR
jgi:hypothetical protein